MMAKKETFDEILLNIKPMCLTIEKEKALQETKTNNVYKRYLERNVFDHSPLHG